LKLNGTHYFLVYADDVNIFGGSSHTLKKNTKPLLLASKDIGLGVNVDKIKHMVMSWNQNTGRSHNKRLMTVSLKGSKFGRF